MYRNQVLEFTCFLFHFNCEVVVILFLSDDSVRVLMRVLRCGAEGSVLLSCVLVLRVDNYSLHLRSNALRSSF